MDTGTADETALCVINYILDQVERSTECCVLDDDDDDLEVVYEAPLG